jgi:ribonuclease HI
MRTIVLLLASAWVLAAQGQPPVRVLFLGNSYTHFNNLPGMVADLAKATATKPSDRLLETRSVTRGGANLSELWAITPALETLREGKWDVVVLQDFSTLGHAYIDGQWRINEPSAMWRWAKLWQTEIERQGGRTLLYLTWARKARPEFQTGLNYAYSEAAAQLGATLAPAGVAWERLRKTAPNIELFDPDGSHPSPIGSLLTACVFLETLVERDCTTMEKPLPGARLDAEQWKQLAEAAKWAVEQNRIGALSNLLRPDFGGEKILPVPLADAPPPSWKGTWRGTANLYEGKYQMALEIQDASKTCRGRLRLEHKAKGLLFEYPLSDCRIEGASLSFFVRDPRQMNEQYKVVFLDGKLVGTQVLRDPDPYVRIFGSFTLELEVKR